MSIFGFEGAQRLLIALEKGGGVKRSAFERHYTGEGLFKGE
jgi:hypothetical protein